MRDEDKPFICYRRGRWHMQFKPRNGEGWRLLGMWMLPFALLTTGHLALVATMPQAETLIGWTTAVFVVLALILALAMIRWMLDRSEVIWLDKGGRK